MIAVFRTKRVGSPITDEIEAVLGAGAVADNVELTAFCCSDGDFLSFLKGGGHLRNCGMVWTLPGMVDAMHNKGYRVYRSERMDHLMRPGRMCMFEPGEPQEGLYWAQDRYL
jgi:hypothetical protein